MSNSKSPKNGNSAAEAARIALADAQFATVGNRLKALSATEPLLRAYGEDPGAYAGELTKQYAALASRPRPSFPAVKDISPRVALTLDHLADIFGPWQIVAAPKATVGLVEKPTSSKTSGDVNGIYVGQFSNATKCEGPFSPIAPLWLLLVIARTPYERLPANRLS